MIISVHSYISIYRKTYSVTGIKKKIRKTSTRKKYKVKVRAYKKVKGKKYYGDWSKTVSAK